MSAMKSLLRRFLKHDHQPPQLKTVSAPPDVGPKPLPLSPAVRLSEFFEQSYIPLKIRQRGLATGTERCYRESVAWWRKLTGDPPLSAIDEFTLAAFACDLGTQMGRKSEHLSPVTIRNHCINLQAILSLAGPKAPTRRAWKNQEILADPLFFEFPRLDVNPPSGDFSLAEVAAILRAAAKARRSKATCVHPCDFWRAFIVTDICTGLRVGQMMGLCYIDLQPPWITVWASSSKGRRGKRCYLPRVALAWLEKIRGPRSAVFHFANWPKSARSLSDQWKRLLAWANIPPHRQFGFNGLRKANATLLASIEAEESAAGQLGIAVAQHSLGHTTNGTTTRHYINGSLLDRLLADRADRLGKLLEAILAAIPESERQQKLF